MPEDFTPAPPPKDPVQDLLASMDGQVSHLLNQAVSLRADLSQTQNRVGELLNAVDTLAEQVAACKREALRASQPVVSSAEVSQVAAQPTEPIRVEHVGPEGSKPAAAPETAPLPAPMTPSEEKPKEPYHPAPKKQQTKNSPGPKKVKTDTVGHVEVDLGVKWFSRIGIVVLLIGVVMGLTYAFPVFPAEMKVLVSLAITAVLFFFGNSLIQGHAILGRILQAGGVAMGYVTLFGAFFIPDMQLLDNQWLGWSLLTAYVAAMLFWAHKIESQTVALLSLGFGYYTASYSGSEQVAYLTTGLLGLAAVALCTVHTQWNWLLKGCLVGSFGTYLNWLGFNTGSTLHVNIGQVPTGTFSIKQLYLIFTFLLFHLASFLPREKGDELLLLVNTFAFYALYAFTQDLNLLPNGLLEASIGLVMLGSMWLVDKLGQRAEKRQWMDLSMILTLIFVTLATLQYFDGLLLATVLAGEALALGWLSLQGHYRRTSQVASWLLLAGAALLLPFQLHPFVKMGVTPATEVLGALGVILVGYILERTTYRSYPQVVKVLLLGALSLDWLIALVILFDGQALTLSWVLTGFVLILTGLAMRIRLYRWMGLAWLLLSGGKLLLVDTMMLSVPEKILLYLVLGVGLLGASYLYSRIGKRLLEDRTPDGNEEAIEGPAHE
jgi:hypothetical protein